VGPETCIIFLIENGGRLWSQGSNLRSLFDSKLNHHLSYIKLIGQSLSKANCHLVDVFVLA
jgi:hypothetical protein